MPSRVFLSCQLAAFASIIIIIIIIEVIITELADNLSL